MKSTLKVLVILMAMLMATTACAEGLTDVSMAFCTWTGYAPMFIARSNGYFEEAGLNMDIQVIEDESTYAALITTGNIDFLATAQDPNIKMFANGATSRYVLAMDASCGADGLVATADIQTLDDLAGKSLALDKSASSYYFFLTALENGSSLSEADINVVDMGDTTEAGLAFMSGSVDAAIMWEPELSEALEIEGDGDWMALRERVFASLERLHGRSDVAGAALPLITARDWMIMIILGVVQVAGGYGLFNLGIQRISAQKASVLALWEMILGPLWVALFLGLYPNPEVLTGFGIILFGILMDSRMNRA